MEDYDQDSAASPSGGRKPNAVVGIAASILSLKSLELFFLNLQDLTDTAIIVVMSHETGADHERVIALLSGAGVTSIETVDGDKPLLPAKVYVAPSRTFLKIEDDMLRAFPVAQGPDHDGVIDTLMLSLAQTYKAHGIAVALGGLGDDGMLGIATTKSIGGLALAEAGTGRGHDRYTDAADIVDYVMTAAEMPEHIAGYVRHLVEQERSGFKVSLDDLQAGLGRVVAILRRTTGHDFHGYKQNTFLRRIQRRMQVVQIDDMDSYVEHLNAEPREVQHLFQDLLIGVTQFFRDTPEFDLLASRIIPKIFDRKGADDKVRVWVLGCATGEEAYSLAILMREHMATLSILPQVQIFATDIDGRALASARAGRFADSVAEQVSPARLSRWFVKEGSTYVVAKELREMCIFSTHNVTRDAPFSRIDLISCRNLLIYLNGDLQNRLIPLFHFSLKPGGVLFLGPSENVTRHPNLFAPVDRKHRIFQRLEGGPRIVPEFPLATGNNRMWRTDGPRVSEPRTALSGLSKRAERIAERYAPGYVVVDEHHEVLHFSGRTGQYLEPAAGAANLNIVNLVHRDLRLDLRAALHKASAHRQPVKIERLQIGHENERRFLNLLVEPVSGETEGPGNLVVLFQEVGFGAFPHGTEATGADTSLRDDHVLRLDAELRLTKDRLQATIEELESTNEELKSSNEEYQSINEELQSANEELETSKEELQSVNEELQTVNGELALRVNDLGRANSDLKNLLESTQIATLFLDNDLRVMNFTPSATEIFHLLDTDIGRPIDHIAARVDHGQVREDIAKVLRTLAVVEREVGNPKTGSRYLMRILPYRSLDNFIAGVVLTFADITPIVRAERGRHASEERLAEAQAAARIGVWEWDLFSDVEWWSSLMYEHAGVDPKTPPSLRAAYGVHPEDRPDYLREIEQARLGENPLRIEYRVRHPALGEIWLQTIGEARRDTNGLPVRLTGVTLDITEQKRSDRRMALLLAELQHRVKNILSVVRSLASTTMDRSDSRAAFAAHFEGRLGALARAHGMMSRQNDSEVDLEELVRDEVLAQVGLEGDKVVIDGAQVRLPRKSAEMFGLALHELCTNAVKYGALSVATGRVAVNWRIELPEAGPHLRLEWRESGVALPEDAMSRRGFGRDLLEQGLPYELGASTSFDFAPDGVSWVLKVPLGRRPARLGQPATAALAPRAIDGTVMS